MASTAPVTWAQRNGSVYFTIVLPDVKEPTIDLQEDKLTFRCVFKSDCCAPRLLPSRPPSHRSPSLSLRSNLQWHV